MGILRQALGRNKRAVQVTPELWSLLDGYGQTAAGVQVTPETALTYSAVWGAVRILAESVAQLPLLVYERQGRAKRRAPEHYLYGLLHDAANPEMTAFEFRETMMGHLATWGNGYAEIAYDRGGRPRELWPLRPDMMRVMRMRRELVYDYTLPDGGMKLFARERILHLRGLGGDGLVGYSPVGLHRQAIGLGLAAEEFGARFYGNDATPGGIVEHPGEMGEEAYQRFLKSWEERHKGLNKIRRIAILEEGMKYHAVGLPLRDAQFLETRKLQVNEVARIYRIPPHMLADLERATFSNIEHQSLDFVVHTLGPWLKRWEQRLQLSLLPANDRRRYFAEFLVAGLLRGDIQSRYSAYSVGRQWGWLSADDVREMENMNPLPDERGGIYLQPLNMVPAGAQEIGREGERALLGASEKWRVGRRDDWEARAKRTAVGRQRLQATYMGMFADAAGRVARREANDVGNGARRFLQRGDATGFGEWLAQFYAEYPAFAREQMRPAAWGYAQMVAEEAAAEIAMDAEVDEERLAGFLTAYLEAFGTRYASRSEARLREILAEYADDPLPEIETQLADWRETRAGRVAHEETVRAGNAVAKFAYGLLGATALRWVAVGESCPYCLALSGTVVGINDYFAAAGESLPGDDTRPALTLTRSVGHPPAHEGCDCVIVAEIV